MDEEIKNVMIEVRSENEYNEMVQCILHEKQRDSLFLEQNKKLKDYYTAKCNY